MCSHDFSMRARSLSLERRRGLVVGLRCCLIDDDRDDWHLLEEDVSRVAHWRLQGAKAVTSSAKMIRKERYCVM